MAGSVSPRWWWPDSSKHGQAGLHTRDAAPDAKEIGVTFQIGRTRRMVGRDHIDIAIEHLLPQGVAFGSGPQRGRTLGDGAQPLHVFFGKEEIVRAGLDREIGAAGARFQRRRHSRARS